MRLRHIEASKLVDFSHCYLKASFVSDKARSGPHVLCLSFLSRFCSRIQYWYLRFIAIMVSLWHRKVDDAALARFVASDFIGLVLFVFLAKLGQLSIPNIF